MTQFHAVSRAGVGAFIRDFVKSFSGSETERDFVIEDRREALMAAHAEPPVAAPDPAPPVRPRRSGRLIDLERRAKFARFDAIR